MNVNEEECKLTIQTSIPYITPASKFTQQTVTILILKDKIKFLYFKKQYLNQLLLQLHLLVAHSWNKSLPYIQNMIEEKSNATVKIKYKELDTLVDKLMQEQIKTQHTRHRVINETDITFFYNKGLSLLGKGLKYSLHAKKKNWTAKF